MLYLAERERPASTQISSILRTLWVIQRNWTLFSRDGYRPVRLSRTTARSDAAWKNEENTRLVLYYLAYYFVDLFWTSKSLQNTMTSNCLADKFNLCSFQLSWREPQIIGIIDTIGSCNIGTFHSLSWSAFSLKIQNRNLQIKICCFFGPWIPFTVRTFKWHHNH